MDVEGRARNATDGESAPADPAKRTQAAVGANNFASRGEVAGQERKPGVASDEKVAPAAQLEELVEGMEWGKDRHPEVYGE
jgi:hypothetical protein